jgi:hypothetical protein
MPLAPAHHAEGGARDAVDGDVEDHAPARAVSLELAHKCLQLLELLSPRPPPPPRSPWSEADTPEHSHDELRRTTDEKKRR